MCGSQRVSLHLCIALLLITWYSSPVHAQYSACQQLFLDAVAASGRNASAKMVDFIDPDTPEAHCKLALCQGDYAACDPAKGDGITKEDLVLVFSDEFEKAERRFGVKDKDKRWTAEDMYYFPTQDLEVYKPEQVMTWNGRAVITIDQPAKPVEAISLQPDGKKWNVPKNYKSAMLNSWNKWCFTGGYMEMSIKMPGKPNIPGFWPAFWAMGNLGRAGYMPSTSGFWPYSYSECGGGSSQATAIPGSQVPPQLIPACPQNMTSPNYINLTKYGFKEGVARNAPEFDVFEVVITKKGPEVSQTLQMAPLLPEGQSWADLAWYKQQGIPEGVKYPGDRTFMATEGNTWTGSYGRPGNTYQDSISAISLLTENFWEDFHTFGVDWAPGEYLRWYVDGQFAYEINPNALLPRSGVMNNQTINIGARMIPIEPMYIIWNLGMSKDFGEVDVENLPFPSYMFVDYIRVYQRANNIKLGCDPPDMPTSQWIACHRDKYIVHDADNVLIPQKCNSAAGRTVASVSAVLVTVLATACLLLFI